LRGKGPWKGGFMNWCRLGKKCPLFKANRITKKAAKKLIKSKKVAKAKKIKKIVKKANKIRKIKKKS